MRDEASLRRLAEMDIDVYVPRLVRELATLDRTVASAERESPSRARVVLLARDESTAAKALLAQIARALAFAGIDTAVEQSMDPNDSGAAAVVAFGEAFARDLENAVPAERRKRLQWISAADIVTIGASAQAKRALWDELRPMIRALRDRAGQGG
jgi:hypothetical protein